LPPRERWSEVLEGDPLYPPIMAVRDLEMSGASVCLPAVDIADEQQLRAFLHTYDQESNPPLRGVIHAAGILEHRSLVEMGAEELLTLLRAKMRGGWLLHQLLTERPLDFFVFFSSASALLSSPRLGGYAAANAFLDALAHHCRARGMPALSINWGLWSEAGMATRFAGDDVAAVALRGMGTITTAQGLDSLGLLLNESVAQVAVLPVDWRRWQELYPALVGAPLLEHLVQKEAVGARKSRVPFLTPSMLHAAPFEERRAMLERYLIDLAASVIGMDPKAFDSAQPLNELGVDSLMTVELKNRIELDAGIVVPMVKLLEGPSVSQLAVMFLELLDTTMAAPQPQHRAPTQPHSEEAQQQASALLADVDTLSDEQVDALLNELLAAKE
jgi:acyl carrier protein